MENNITLAGAASLIAEKSKLLILTHIRPDGDTLGSAYGLLHALDGFADARVICAQRVPERLAFITGGEMCLSEERLGDFSPELTVALDAAELELMGSYGGHYAGAIDLKLDHHPSGSHYARYNYIDGSASATAELVYMLVRELEAIGAGKLTPLSAAALYAALASDTGCFRYSNVTPNTMRIGAELMEAGAPSSEINELLFERKSAADTVALKLALNGMTLYRKGTVAVFTVTEAMRSKYGLCDDDFGDVINQLRAMDGVVLAMTLRQLESEPQKFRISMRSRAGVYADRLCGHFGGGGHERAAGGWVIADTPEEAEHKVISQVLDEIGHEP